MKVKNKSLLLSLLAIMFMIVLASCGTKQENNQQNDEPINTETEANNGNAENNLDDTAKNNDQNSDTNKNSSMTEDEVIDYSKDTNPIVTLTLENGDDMTIELYPEVAPNTVANFISLIEENYYDGLIFHRVIPNFMIQGGDPDGVGTGGPGYGIPGEFNLNGFDNDLEHERGVISMARSGHPDSAGSQFFIVVQDSPHLDGEYAGFGKVTSGIEAADDIVSTETGQNNKPKTDQRIKTMTVDTKGIDYDAPETID